MTRKVTLMLKPLLLFVSLAAGTCLDAQSVTWIQNPANGKVYGVADTTMSWSAGEAFAVSLGGHLATIRGPAEQAWLEAHFGPFLGPHGLWIGFNDIAVEGVWVWSSGEPVTYTNWAPGQPDNGGTLAENAGQLFGTNAGSSQWQWNDETESFSNLVFPLIEVPATTLPASYTLFGASCNSPTSTPINLAPLNGGVPRIGFSSSLRLSGLPAGIQVPVFVLGFSDTQNSGPLGSHALPFELSPLGFPGCWQFVSDDSTQFTLALNGHADWQITLPSFTILAGFRFYVQAAVPDAITGTASLSNAVAAVIGY